MSDWKTRWVEQIGDGIDAQLAQFDVWQEHWVALHPEDAPPNTVRDDEDQAVGELFQNLDKYLNDPEVLDLCQRHRRVVSLDRQRLLRAERLNKQS